MTFNPVPTLVTVLGYSQLLCPTCGEPYLHHTGVRIASRHGEDCPEGMVVSFDQSSLEVGVRSSIADDFAGRRDQVDIDFWCENCPIANAPVLRLLQHKGETHLQWIDPSC